MQTNTILNGNLVTITMAMVIGQPNRQTKRFNELTTTTKATTTTKKQTFGLRSKKRKEKDGRYTVHSTIDHKKF